MTISARLSRTLHLALGEDGAADMMNWMSTVDDHRAELRALNELSVARVEARIDAVEARLAGRIGQFEARLETRIVQGEARLDARISQVEAKIDKRFADLIKWSFLFWCAAVATLYR